LPERKKKEGAMMRYCTNCGNLLNDLDTVCPACHTVTKSSGQTPAQAVVKEKRPSEPEFSIAGFKDNFWVSGLRSWGQLLFIGSLIAGGVAGYTASHGAWNGERYLEAFGLFFIAFLPFAIGGFLLVALLMLFVEMASDIAKIRYMLGNRR
jgi:hypothetical protein